MLHVDARVYILYRVYISIISCQLFWSMIQRLPLDLCIGNTYEQTHIEYLEYFSFWNGAAILQCFGNW